MSIDRKKADYTLFLPAITAWGKSKSKSKSNVSDQEFRSIVATVFRDTVIKFIRETRLYRTDIPIDCYAGCVVYDIIPPDGFYISSALDIKSGEAEVPARFKLTDTELWLIDCCPEKDVDRAWYINVSIVPERSGKCEFDAEFIERYYDVILAGMKYEMASMRVREWHSVTTVPHLRREYIELRKRAVRSGVDNVRAVKLKYKRLSGRTNANLCC